MQRTVRSTLVAVGLTSLILACPARAGDRATVEPFYAFLSNPASEAHAAAVRKVMATAWKSTGDYSGRSKTADAFIEQVGGFGKLIPDLEWEMVEVITAGEKVVVRGRATGTPRGPMFGVDGEGRGFDIMTIDIHTVKHGLIVESHHVEDWAGALRQLSAR